MAAQRSISEAVPEKMDARQSHHSTNEVSAATAASLVDMDEKDLIDIQHHSLIYQQTGYEIAGKAMDVKIEHVLTNTWKVDNKNESILSLFIVCVISQFRLVVEDPKSGFRSFLDINTSPEYHFLCGSVCMAAHQAAIQDQPNGNA